MLSFKAPVKINGRITWQTKGDFTCLSKLAKQISHIQRASISVVELPKLEGVRFPARTILSRIQI